MSRMISYSLYEFRNVKMLRIFKQNRIISISSRLIEFWCFGLPVALRVGGCLDDGGGGWGYPPHMCTCTRMHTCTHTFMRGKHDNFTQMAASIGFLGNSWEFPMM